MNRTFLTVALASVVVFGGGSAVAKGIKVGVVNMQRAVSETKEGQAAEARLEKMKKKLESELNRKLKEFYKKEGEMRKGWSILSEKDRQRKAAESRKKFEALQKRYLQAERSLMKKKAAEIRKISNKLGRVIERIAKRDKYDYIFNNAAVLWAPRHTDLTNEVIRQFDRGR